MKNSQHLTALPIIKLLLCIVMKDKVYLTNIGKSLTGTLVGQRSFVKNHKIRNTMNIVLRVTSEKTNQYRS